MAALAQADPTRTSDPLSCTTRTAPEILFPPWILSGWSSGQSVLLSDSQTSPVHISLLGDPTTLLWPSCPALEAAGPRLGGTRVVQGLIGGYCGQALGQELPKTSTMGLPWQDSSKHSNQQGRLRHCYVPGTVLGSLRQLLGEGTFPLLSLRDAEHFLQRSP